MPDGSPPPRRFRDGLARFAATRPVHGECGGYMVLGESLEDADGVSHAMAGLLGHATSFAQRKLHLGYREARLLSDSPIGRAGGFCAGTSSTMRPCRDRQTKSRSSSLPTARAQTLGTSGGRRGHVTGTFFHAIAASAFSSLSGHDLVGNLGLGEGRHAGVASECGAQHQHGNRGA